MAVFARLAHHGRMPVHTPLPPPTPRAEAAPSPDRLAHPLALVGVAALVSSVVALVTGIPLGALTAVAAANDCSPSEMWCDLGAALLGGAVGAAAAGVAYVTSGVVIVRRCRPAGRRAGYIVAHLAVPVVLIALASLLAGL